MLANYLIGLREGIEAALIVSILIAYLVKIDQRAQIKKIVLGVSLAVVLAVGLGVLLSKFIQNEPAGTQEFISGVISILAVGFVTWMIFWMKSQSRALSKSLHGKIDTAISSGSYALATVAFLAVIREGIETSVFIWSASGSTGADTNPVLGAVLGLLTASALGVLMYRGAVKINLASFFKYTGAFLIVVAAGILAYGVSELQEIGMLPFLQQTAYDVTAIVPDGSVLDAILRGTISFNSAPSLLVSLFWAGYILPTAYIYLKAAKTKTA
jgi:high-affinity iron transporter